MKTGVGGNRMPLRERQATEQQFYAGCGVEALRKPLDRRQETMRETDKNLPMHRRPQVCALAFPWLYAFV